MEFYHFKVTMFFQLNLKALYTILKVLILLCDIKRVDTIGVASTLGNKTIRIRLFI